MAHMRYTVLPVKLEAAFYIKFLQNKLNRKELNYETMLLFFIFKAGFVLPMLR